MQPFDARWPCPFAPLSTLRLPPHSDRRMTRGEGGRLLLPSAGLPPAVLRQLAWRTPVCSLNRPRRPFLVGVLQPMSLPPSSAPTATGWSDGVDASPGRHRNVPRWMCRDTTHLKEEASSGTRYHHRDRLGEAQFSAPWRTGRRVGCVPQEAEPEQGAGFRGVAAALCRGDGGLREFTPLGPRDRKARSCGEARPTDLREAGQRADGTVHENANGLAPTAALPIQHRGPIEVAGLHRSRGAPAPSRATFALRSYVRRPQFAAALSTGSILSTAPASWSVVTYSRPSGPCFTSRIRWLSSVSSGM